MTGGSMKARTAQAAIDALLLGPCTQPFTEDNGYAYCHMVDQHADTCGWWQAKARSAREDLAVVDYWRRHYVFAGRCGLCDDTGYISPRYTIDASQPDPYKPPQESNMLLCLGPTGQAIRWDGIY